MTITAPGPAVDVGSVLELLGAGVTTARIAELTRWPQERVVQLARKQRGWILSAETDTVIKPEDIDPDDEKRRKKLPYGDVPPLLLRAEDLDDPAVGKALTRVQAELGRLRDAIADVDRRAALEAERQQALAAVEKAKRQLADAEARAKELGALGKRKTATSGPTAKEIRAWAAQNDVPCNERGHVPERVVQQYLAAHRAGA